MVTSAVTTDVATIQAKHKDRIFSLREMIKKSLHLKKSSSTTLSPNLDITPKTHPNINFLPKTTTHR